MFNTYCDHFVKMARRSHECGMKLRRMGLPAQAFVKFAERDMMMSRARR